MNNLFLGIFSVCLISGCSEWNPGWESKKKEISRTEGAEGYYRDYTKGLSFLIVRDGTLWGWDERGAEAFYSELDLIDDKDDPYFEGDLLTFTNRDYLVSVEGSINGYYENKSDITGVVLSDKHQSFNAIYDDLYEERPSLFKLSGDYRNQSSFINIGEGGEFEGVWGDCAFNGTAKASRFGNYFEFSLVSPDYECLYAVGDEIEGVMLNDSDELILVGMDEMRINGVFLDFKSSSF